ncbi:MULTISPECIES: metal-sulfur cluster assembly factor [Lactobacillus]|uniref:Metal-sulfur cluster assembly factor n=1 Tax=Lactobacillus xujianguonis TaxID=2495899 RepID=A0A437SU99_9LACO|nr:MULTISPECIES: metal-sulfur cluster assembly factor [Lactobacillus]RVU70519.1 metal-sulfur cluster assembly factor [Lactobacillus xujianguonis]RVU77016.1 metal-sulfur cluster assembly factor [Lactobacillus xujianguonis]
MREAKVIKDDIINHLAQVIDPELGIDVVNLGLIYGIDLDKDGICLINMTLTTPGCPLVNTLEMRIKAELKKVPEIKNVDVEYVWYPVWTPDKISEAGKIALGIM